MNILILNWKDIRHPQVGGAEIIVYELARRMAKDGHKVTWFCRRFANCQTEEIIDDIKIVRKGNLITTYLLAPLYYWSLNQKPDLVIDISNTIYWQTPLWAWKSKKIAYLNQLGQDVFFYEFPLIISRLGMLIEKLQYLSYYSTPFVCYANSTKQDLTNLGINPNHVKLFSLGLDHDRYVPGRKSHTPLFVCINRLVKMKRVDLVISAMATVTKTYPDAKLIIVGTGYDRPRLEALRDKINVQSSVSFADENTWFFEKNNKDKKITLMQQAWALVFPSVKEGWGMTVTECAACGTPAIVSNVTGLRDSVVSNQTGIVLSSDPPPTEIAAAMIQLIKNKNLRLQLSTNARKYAKTFSWEKSYSEFTDIINNL